MLKRFLDRRFGRVRFDRGDVVRLRNKDSPSMVVARCGHFVVRCVYWNGYRFRRYRLRPELLEVVLR